MSARPDARRHAAAASGGAGLGARTILHAGPPIAWARMCGPVAGRRRSARSCSRAGRPPPRRPSALARDGEIDFAPCHDHGAVGPMAGIISPSMPVVVVENAPAGNRAFATLNEGLGKVLRFGAYDARC